MKFRKLNMLVTQKRKETKEPLSQKVYFLLLKKKQCSCFEVNIRKVIQKN